MIVGPPFEVTSNGYADGRKNYQNQLVAVDVVLGATDDIIDFYKRKNNIYDFNDSNNPNNLKAITIVGQVIQQTFSEKYNRFDKIQIVLLSKNTRFEDEEVKYMQTKTPQGVKFISVVLSWFYLKNLRLVEPVSIEDVPLSN
jgi:hypothetical protein